MPNLLLMRRQFIPLCKKGMSTVWKQYSGVHFYGMHTKNDSMLRINNVFGIFKRGQRHSPESPSFQRPAPGRWLVNRALRELWLSASPRSLPRWCVHQLHDRWHQTALSVIGISHLAEQQGTPKCPTIFINMFKLPRARYHNHRDCTIGATRGSFPNHTYVNESQLSYLPKWHHETNKSWVKSRLKPDSVWSEIPAQSA